MKNRKLCPKCKSDQILKIEGGMGYESFYIPVGGFKTVRITRYLCEKCGFLETWIDKEEDIHKLIDKYKKN